VEVEVFVGTEIGCFNFFCVGGSRFMYEVGDFIVVGGEID